MSETRRVSNGKSQISNPKSENDEIDKFLKIGKTALEEAIKQAVVGNRVGHISQTIQRIVEKEAGYSIVRSLIGHGVGKDLHEAPEVPGYLVGNINRTPLLKEGMTIAIEVIYNMGTHDVVLDRDHWTIRTRDGRLSGLYERTIAITKDGPLLLTK
jgi:methionyl aminopeptidase